MEKGFLHLVLHAHLPYVRHPEYDSFLEEHWLFEAISECYVPLLQMLDRLQQDDVQYRLTLSLSPTLMTLLQDDLLQQRYVRYLDQQQQLINHELDRTRQDEQYAAIAAYYHELIGRTRQAYQDSYQGNLLKAFARHEQLGKLKLITTAATHGFLPLLNRSEAAVEWQVATGLDTFEQSFGFTPDTIWLPECAYYQGLENVLKKAGVDYFMLDGHGVLNASPQPISGIHAPVCCENGLVVFGRDAQVCEYVWNAQTGYPGDPAYREFYSDIGQELEPQHLQAFNAQSGDCINTGIKYHSISQPQNRKVYVPHAATEKAHQHAADFVERIQLKVRQLNQNSKPVVNAAFDAELFGHWWFEGPQWLEQVIRLSSTRPELEMISGDDYLQTTAHMQTVQPAASSWGHLGFNQYWLNDNNDWIYPQIYQAFDHIAELVQGVAELSLTSLQQRALNQALRSLLLMQSSDWPFLMTAGTATEFAEKNVTDQLARFNYLYDNLRKNRVNERFLSALEIMDDIFPQLDYKAFYRILLEYQCKD